MRWCMRPCWTHCSSISEQRALRFFTVSSKCCFSNASCSSSLLHTHTHTQLLYSHYQRTKHYTTNKLNSSSTFFSLIYDFLVKYICVVPENETAEIAAESLSVCAHILRERMCHQINGSEVAQWLALLPHNRAHAPEYFSLVSKNRLGS